MKAAEPSGAGPWWIATFRSDGRRHVIRFKLDGEDFYPVRLEPLGLAAGEPPPRPAAMRAAALAVVGCNRPLIEAACEIGGDIEAARRLCAAEGYRDEAAA